MKFTYIITIICALFTLAILPACNEKKVTEYVEVIDPITKRFDVDTLLWKNIVSKKLNPEIIPVNSEILSPNDPQFDTKLLPTTTINSNRIQLANHSNKTLRAINLWAKLNNNPTPIRVAYVDSIQSCYEVEFIPYFVQTYAILPSTNATVVKIFLPSININSNIQFSFRP